MATSQAVETTRSERLKPSTATPETAFPLSLVDATAANFALTSAFWCYESPPEYRNNVDELVTHLRRSLSTTLNAYPHWSGHVRGVDTIDGSVPPEAEHFPPHARRFGRVYVHYGTEDDPGVSFAVAKSSLTLDELHPEDRPSTKPTWDRDYATDPFVKFLPSTSIRKPLQPYSKDESGHFPAALAVQLTHLACGGTIVAASLTHCLGDITALVQFFKDWASVSRSMLAGENDPYLAPAIDSSRLDAAAAGDINKDQPDDAILKLAGTIPLARYDWWMPSEGKPWPVEPPAIYEGQDLSPFRDTMPWKDWDTTAPVSNYTIHLTRDQVDILWTRANTLGTASESGVEPETSPAARISRHDAILAHIWSCITRARRFAADDNNFVHCYPTLGLRPALGLDSSFIGSPILMLDLKMPASSLAAAALPSSSEQTGVKRNSNIITTAATLRDVAQYIRATLSSVNSNTAGLAAHLHSIAYEKSPQRIWHGFLGRRHTMVTTWARAGLYDVDFGLHGSSPSPALRYADGIMPRLDGCILVKEGPPRMGSGVGGTGAAWTENGVDVAVAMNSEDMKRFLADPALFPAV